MIIKGRTMRRAEHLLSAGQMRNIYKILIGKPEGKRRPRGR
jgi:hypothetical protein